MATSPTTLWAMRFPTDLLARCDALIEPLSRRIGGSGLLTRTSVVRLALVRGVELLEQESGLAPPPKKPAKRKAAGR